MTRREIVFDCGDVLTPEVAVRLVRLSEHYGTELFLECGGKRVRLDSLIGILALDCPRGTRVTVLAADGGEAAALATAKLLEGREQRRAPS